MCYIDCFFPLTRCVYMLILLPVIVSKRLLITKTDTIPLIRSILSCSFILSCVLDQREIHRVFTSLLFSSLQFIKRVYIEMRVYQTYNKNGSNNKNEIRNEWGMESSLKRFKIDLQFLCFCFIFSLNLFDGHLHLKGSEGWIESLFLPDSS